MSTLTKQKREAYKLMLKKENQQLTKEQLDQMIEFLFDLACLETKAGKDEND